MTARKLRPFEQAYKNAQAAATKTQRKPQATPPKAPPPTTAEAVAMAADSIAADLETIRRALSRSSTGALTTVEATISARDHLWLLERLTVMNAREHGATWAELGQRYKVTRQAAQQRLSDPSEPIQ